jgi:ribosomal protein L15E
MIFQNQRVDRHQSITYILYVLGVTNQWAIVIPFSSGVSYQRRPLRLQRLLLLFQRRKDGVVSHRAHVLRMSLPRRSFHVFQRVSNEFL